VIANVAREAVNLPDQEKLHRPLAGFAVVEKRKELGSVCELRGFAAFNENLQDGEIVLAGIFAARRFL
jgi:hypothetical protein